MNTTTTGMATRLAMVANALPATGIVYMTGDHTGTVAVGTRDRDVLLDAVEALHLHTVGQPYGDVRDPRVTYTGVWAVIEVAVSGPAVSPAAVPA